MNGTSPQEGLDAWLVCGDVSPDVYCACLQEVSSAEQWGQWRAGVAKSLRNVGSYEDVKTPPQSHAYIYITSLHFSLFSFLRVFHNGFFFNDIPPF